MMSSDRNSNSPLRIALVTTELRPGGAERCLTNIALGLDRDQFSPEVYSLAPAPSATESQLVDALAQANIPTHFLGARHFTQLPSVVRKLRMLLRRQSPDVVQSFLFHANVASALAMRTLDAPLLGGLRVAQPQRIRRFVERQLAHRFAGFVCVSRAVAHQSRLLDRPNLRSQSEKMHVIVNGIDVAQVVQATPMDWTTLGIPSQQRVILFVGRLAAQKGVDLLIDAAAEILPRLPEHNLVLVGDGPERRRLARRVRRAGLEPRVHFLGWRPDATSCIAAAELVVLPSRYEGMSNVLLEAMAAGKPVVATVVEGVVEALGENTPWQTCPPNSAAKLARSILHLAQDANLREQLGVANRSRVVEHFSLQKMIDAYARLFQQTVAAHRRTQFPRR